jgi:preprotein translocase subunit YajC
MMAVLALLAPLAGAAAKKTTSGSPVLLIFVAIAAAFYFLIYRPQQRKAKAAREQVNTYEVGDEVLTAGGIVGYVIEIDGDRVTLETSVGASFVVLRQYVLRKIEPVVDDEDDEAGYDDHDQDALDEAHDHDQDALDEAHDHDDADDEHEEEAGPDDGEQPAPRGKAGTPEEGDDPSGPDGPPII